ncbi:MAG TPA: efflux RND transporter periplasmic adaptor subunit [Bryobacteraceae bacterium]|nr:efflux RND transporter periplasmic adaptor subunit [Bryobacteraceae bacterium]
MSSGAASPGREPVGPKIPAPAPTLVPSKPKRSGNKWIVWLLALIVVGVAAERALNSGRQDTSGGGGSSTIAAVRTVAFSQGSVVKTLRLTGTTGAEKYSSLIAPPLRGNRNTAGGGRDGNYRNAGGGGGGGFAIQSNGGGGGRGGGGGNTGGGGGGGRDGGDGGGGGGGGAATASSGGGSSASVASTSGQSAGGSAAFRSATSRVSSGTATRSTGSNVTVSSSSTASSAPVSTGGGGGGGGAAGGAGGGGNEFALILQDAVKPGSQVKKGAVVAEFDRQNMLLRLDDYRASVAQLQASMRKLQADLLVTKNSHAQSIENAKAALEKARLDLKTIPVLSAIDAERVKLAAEEAEARYKQLLAEVKYVEIGQQSQIRNAELEFQEAQVELKRAEANADRMLIKAPIDGLAVMSNLRRSGELVQIKPGDQLMPGMMFMQIVDLSTMIINASVNQVDVDSLRIGQKANVRFDAYPGLEVPATVAAIGAMTRTGGMRAMYVKDVPVILRIDKMDKRIIPDLSVSVDVTIASEENTTVAPLSAVFRDTPDAAPHVYVKKANGWERRPVELGIAGNVYAAVRSGLKPGEVVAEEAPPLDPQKERT